MRFARTAAATLLLALTALAAETALDRYVKKPDPTYKFDIVNTIPGEGYTTYIVDLTSQTWRSAAEVNHPVWKHWLTIVKPDRVTTTTGFLFITGGSIGGKAPVSANAMYTENALVTHSVVAELQDVPNEPLRFGGDTRDLTEDGIIAYTWVKFMKGGDEEWPLRLPMTKAAVRAMDTISTIMATPQAGSVKVEKFVVSGGSKRGWTSWATAAVDPRVAAVIPISIDTLNVEKAFDHHYRVFGFFSPAVKDYQDAGVMDWNGTPQYRKLLAIEDPYNYRDRFTMPKFMIYAAGDQYFLPDSSRYYFDDLKGEKYLRYIPNTDHGLRNTDARESSLAFYQAFLTGTPRPKFSWSFEPGGDIKVTSKMKPDSVRLWQATNPTARDFRLMTIGQAYQGADLQDQGSGTWVAHVNKPDKGWTAYFVELTFPSGGKYPFKFTTAVRVTPDNEPFPSYKPNPEARK